MTLSGHSATRARPTRHRAVTQRDPAVRETATWAWLAVTLLVASTGVLLVATGDALSRDGSPHAAVVFWCGLITVVAPFALRLSSAHPNRAERVLLLAVLMVLLYSVKIIHDPFGFTYADEYVHLRNAQDVIRNHGLFVTNPILPVTTYYPALALVTSALADLAGLSPFWAGVTVVGAARVLLILSLYLLFEVLTGSPRAGALAALTYSASPNFLMWTAQYSYQSLALPMMVAILWTLAERRSAQRGRWQAVVLILGTALVMMHHMTAWALVVVLLSLSLLGSIGRAWRTDRNWSALITIGTCVVIWLLAVAALTVPYLSFVFDRAVAGVVQAASGTGETRQLFHSQGGYTAPLLERAVALGSVALLVMAIPFGVAAIWRARRSSGVLIVIGIGAVAYVLILPLRLVPSAWETANRASDFVFLGVALAVGLALARLPLRTPALRFVTAVITGCFVAITFSGGLIAGWPPGIRLAQPFHVNLGGRAVPPQSVTAARWVRTVMPPDRGWIGPDSGTRILLTVAQQQPAGARLGPVREITEPTTLWPSVLRQFRRLGASYAWTDRRAISDNAMAGVFFAPRGIPSEGPDGLRPPAQITKFDTPRSDRIYDSGDIVLFDVRRLLGP